MTALLWILALPGLILLLVIGVVISPVIVALLTMLISIISIPFLLIAAIITAPFRWIGQAFRGTKNETAVKRYTRTAPPSPIAGDRQR